MATGCLKSRRPCLPSTEPSTTPEPAAGHGFTMAAEKVSRAPVIDVFDRVLDKGIVFDASVRMSAAGIDLSTVDTDVIVASVDTCLNSVAMSGVVLIVAVDRPSLFETIRVVNSVGWTKVVLDRRRLERRRRIQAVAKDRRQAERRAHDVDRELKSVGMAAVVLPETLVIPGSQTRLSN